MRTAFVCFVLIVGNAIAAPPNLPAYGADATQTSVSGLSSGAFMAVQLQVAYSASIVGSGIIAGGPYYCAANNFGFVEICMGQYPSTAPNPSLMVDAAKNFAAFHRIDDLSHLQSRRIYAFSGTEDTVVREPAVAAAVAFFKQIGVSNGNIAYVKNVPAGHALIAPNYGNDCSANTAPYINHCTVDGAQYDQAGTILQHIYGTLVSRVATPVGQIVAFNQRRFAKRSTGMAETAYLYVPQSCTSAGARCKVHVALHGCLQAAQTVTDQFYAHAGYNNWADSNNIIVLYPQVDKSDTPYNPKGCWDWWGYTGSEYAYKGASQMKAIMAMVNRITQAR